VDYWQHTTVSFCLYPSRLAQQPWKLTEIEAVWALRIGGDLFGTLAAEIRGRDWVDLKCALEILSKISICASAT